MSDLPNVVPPARPRVAIVHDWLVTWGGAERVLAEMLALYPDADVFSLVDFLSPDARAELGREVGTSFVQRLPFARKNYWYYVPLMALAVEQFDLRPYDLVLTSSHTIARGVLTAPDQPHISFVHSPMRFVWDVQPDYLEAFRWDHGVRSALARVAFSGLRIWDSRTAHGPDLVMAPSDFIRRRIRKVYGEDAVVVYPPVDTERFAPPDATTPRGDYYLAGSFMNPFKRIDLVVDAFTSTPSRRLIVFGDGPDAERLRSSAGPNVTFVGPIATDELIPLMQAARAFVFGAVEDFGIVMAEAQAAGTPVIAMGRGGGAEIVRDLDLSPEPTGALFAHQTVASLVGALERFEAREGEVAAAACQANAQRFSRAEFRSEFARHTAECLNRG